MSTLQAICEGLFLAEGPNVDFFGFPYPTRMVVAQLAGAGGLWVWSPIALDDALKAEVDALGPVRYLVSPNKIHHLALSEWHAAYPEAKICGLPEIVAKREDLQFDIVLADAPPREWLLDLDQVVFHGSLALEEVVFFHRPSRTVILADLIENFEQEFLDANWKGWQARLAHFAGITAPEGMAPLDFRISFLRRKPAREAFAKLLAWDPERVIMAHGAWVASEGRAFLEHSFRWLVPEASD